MTASPQNGSALLTAEGLTKKYRQTLAIDGVTVSLPRGKIIGFVGENGSGKTTLIRMLTGLIRPTSGTFSYKTDDGKCRIGAIVESPSFFPNMTAYDNLVFQAKLCGCPLDRIPTILEQVGLDRTGKKKAKNFSLGMRQRLGIAIALVSEPEFLILDEPTNGLDPEGIIELRQLLKSLAENGNMTLLVSSHILSELSQLAEWYIFLHKGRIRETADASEMIRHATRELRFSCGTDASASVKRILDGGWAESGFLDAESGKYVLYGPKDFPSILRELSTLPVTDLETREESLEAHYMQLMKGDAS